MKQFNHESILDKIYILETQFSPAVAWIKLKDKVVARNPNILKDVLTMQRCYEFHVLL